MTPSTPFVSVHVVTSGEQPDAVVGTVASLLDLDYPMYEVVVVDADTADDALWQPVEEFCRLHGVEFHHVEDVHPFDYAVQVAHPRTEIVATVLPGHLVASSFLSETTAAFDDDSVGFVDPTLSAEPPTVTPAMTLVRLSALAGVGGWSSIDELTARLLAAGWAGRRIAPPVEPPIAAAAPPRQRRTRPVLAAAAGLSAVVLAAGAVAVWSGSSDSSPAPDRLSTAVLDDAVTRTPQPLGPPRPTASATASAPAISARPGASVDRVQGPVVPGPTRRTTTTGRATAAARAVQPAPSQTSGQASSVTAPPTQSPAATAEPSPSATPTATKPPKGKGD